ncbi:MAG: tetratricopeptide repeat protein [Caldilineaceae bacterium]
MTLRVLGGEERFVEAERMLRESLTLRCDAGDLVGASVTLANLGGLAAQQNHWDEAQRHYLDVLDMRRRMDDRAGIVRALDGLANSAYNLGDYATSCAWAEEGEQLSRRLHDMETLSRHLIFKGRALCAMGRYHAAQAPLRQSLEITATLGVKMNMLFSLYTLVRGDSRRRRTAIRLGCGPVAPARAGGRERGPQPGDIAQHRPPRAYRVGASPGGSAGHATYVDVGVTCSLDDAMQVGYQIVARL